MGAINLPANIQNGDPLDADSVMADLNAIVTQANGLLEAASNVRVLAPPASNVGNQNSEGTSGFLSRADHQHVIQGVENVTTLPTSGNFLGRMVYVTSGVNLGKLMICTDAGANTFLTMGGLFGTTDVPVHAVEHKVGGHDPLANNTITDAMLDQKANIFSAPLTANQTNISGSSYTSLVPNLTVTTTGIQTLAIYVTLRVRTTNTCNFSFRVQNTTAANVTIYASDAMQITQTAIQTQISGFFFYTVPAGGANVLRVQAGCTQASACDVLQAAPVNGEAYNTPMIQAVII